MAKQKTQRNTQQRQVILEELRKLKSHPTVAELYAIVRQRLPRISLGTVYRNLELLAQKSIIKKLDVSGSEARFDGDIAHHHHVRCIRCLRVDDIFDVPNDMSVGKFMHPNGYEVLGCRLEFIGICPECGGNAKAEGNKVQH
jgi:Fur family ferric uptake transcriptional regulator